MTETLVKRANGFAGGYLWSELCSRMGAVFFPLTLVHLCRSVAFKLHSA